ncbi:CHAT domain-containing tetratricopeptide repeat protein [uncultured Imperialibacter sp.]|uniref:CHAT domain-containing tetratricopeptide repeat protein n=1 Tax=uncultured Imperialibacter sp. TaxID=1672639 RepID=UPI0030DA97B6|tara:strand:- start:40653 stop:43337 length:2685 start_codon:yes stop_codon:yes gene_type:complete
MKLSNQLFWFFLFINIAAQAQDALMEQAENEQINANYSTAYDHFEQAAAGFFKANQNEKAALCQLRMAECQLALGDPQWAQAIVQSNELAEIIKGSGNLSAISLNILGDIYLRSGRNDLALEELLKAEKLLPANSLEQAKCYNDLGVVYWNNGNRELALQYHEKALSIRQSAGAGKAVLLADSYNNIGLIYLQDLPAFAVDYFNKALAIYKDNLGENHPKVASGYSNLAFATANQGSYDKAITYLDQVMNIWNATYTGDHPNKAFTTSNKGRVTEMKGSLEEALAFQRVALQMYQNLYGEKHPEIANTYFLIGSIYQKQNKFELAVESFQKSIYANLYSQNYQTIYDLPELRDYYNADILLSSLQSKAKNMEALHFEKTLKLRDIDGALAAYVACDELITSIRQIRLNEADKLRLGAVAYEVYENGISTALYLSERTFKKQYYQKLAFNFCERSKSAVLLDAINDAKAKHFAGIPDEELALEDSLKDQIIFIEQKLAGGKLSPEKEEELEAELFAFESALRSFIEMLEDQYPEYFKLKYSNTLASAETLQPLLSEDQGILSYFIGEENVYVFLVGRHRLKATTIKKDPDFARNIVGLRNAIKYRQQEVFQKASEALYKQLIPKLPASISSLVVLPDGPISAVPFESLIIGRDKDGTINYLISEKVISYDYSATLLAERIASKSSSTGNGILLSAPLSFEKNEVVMQTLPDTEKEVKEIKFLFTGSDQEANLMLSAAASESFIKSDELGQYKFLHFATHGMVNEAKPELSRIFLSPGNDEDGSLYSGEIYSLGINADLVNLSACETALGKITRGEGIIGLSRALMYAGAKNLIVSLWQVADASTASLMIEFYRQHLYHSDNNLFADDLRKAKLSLLNSENYKDPYYWAPFILVGL